MTDEELLSMYHRTPGLMTMEQIIRVKTWYENLMSLMKIYNKATGSDHYGLTFLSILDSIDEYIVFKKRNPEF